MLLPAGSDSEDSLDYSQIDNEGNLKDSNTVCLFRSVVSLSTIIFFNYRLQFYSQYISSTGDQAGQKWSFEPGLKWT